MRLLILLLIIASSFSCKNSKTKDDNQKKSITKNAISKHPDLFPSNLKIKAVSHDLILNTNLFEKYNLNKNDTAAIRATLKNTDFNYTDKFYTFIQKSKFQEPNTYAASENVKFELSFECNNCYDAILIRTEMNSSELINDTILPKFLDDPASIDRKIKKNGNVFQIIEDFDLTYDGFLGIYLVLRNKSKELMIYEIAGIKADASSPTFKEGEFCNFSGDTAYQGMVCLTTKQFEGNDYSGYSVPVKGNIYGDVKSLSINGKNVKFNQGEFYQRIHMMLKIGYNQIPIIIKDKFANTTETYIKVTLERIKKEPDINIDNNIDIN
jgi:hypothetical protein